MAAVEADVDAVVGCEQTGANGASRCSSYVLLPIVGGTDAADREDPIGLLAEAWIRPSAAPELGHR
jgi:hypothetical protein